MSNEEIIKQIIKEHKGKIVGYIRTACIDEQSIERQKDIILCFCNKNNAKCEKIYIDAGFSGRNFERPGISKITRSRREKVILVSEISKFSRNIIDLIEYIYRNDKIIIEITDNIIIGKDM